MRDELTTPWHADPEEAEALVALGKTGRARKAGRTYTPSVHAHPLPGTPGVPARGAILDFDESEVA
jgi:hypothetical protein